MIAGEVSRRAVQDAGERTLLIGSGGVRRSGREIERRTTALAMALLARGLGGRRIGLWYWNGPAAIEAFLAVEWIGGTRVPVDPGAPADETAAVFAAAEVEAVLTDNEHLARADRALLHDEDAPLSSPGSLPPLTVSPETTLMLYPRMASRGELMAVPISYANWNAAMEINMALYRSGAYGPPLGKDECFLTAQQIMHGTGLIGTFPFLCMGLPQVLLRRFEAADAADAILEHRVTSTFFVPGMVSRLAGVAAERALRVSPPLRRVLYGGAPADPAALRRAIDVIGRVFVQLYGRFEGGWPLSILSPDDHLAHVGREPLLGRSCGRPIAQTEIRLRPVPGQPSDAGELCVRNGMVVHEAADPDGWCALGDIVRRDESGYLYLGGRLDGMINTGSYHVYPREVADAIAAVDGVRDALVRGEPDPVWGQAVTAYVVLAPGAAANLVDTLRPALGRRLASYKIPKRFHIVPSLDELPPTGGEKN